MPSHRTNELYLQRNRSILQQAVGLTCRSENIGVPKVTKENGECAKFRNVSYSTTHAIG